VLALSRAALIRGCSSAGSAVMFMRMLFSAMKPSSTSWLRTRVAAIPSRRSTSS
jgi:hypothetical protein